MTKRKKANINNKTLTVSPAVSSFYAFDPAANLLFDTDNPGTPVSGSTLTNITAVGLHIQHREYPGGLGRSQSHP